MSETWISSWLGGSMIGAAAGSFLLLNGDILDISSILASFFVAPKETMTNPKYLYKSVTVASFVATIFLIFSDSTYLTTTVSSSSSSSSTSSRLALVVGGWAMGSGTILAQGGIVGHAVCGLAQWNPRSFLCVVTCWVVAMLPTFALTGPGASIFAGDYFWKRTNEDEQQEQEQEVSQMLSPAWAMRVSIIVIALAVQLSINAYRDSPEAAITETSSIFDKYPGAIVSGSLYAAGIKFSPLLIFSSKVFAFLNVGSGERGGEWDSSLIWTFLGAWWISFVSYQAIAGYSFVSPKFYTTKLMKKPLVGTETFGISTNRNLKDGTLLVGSILLGLGLGVSGLLPASALFLAAMGHVNVLVFYWPAFAVGCVLAQSYKDYNYVIDKVSTGKTQ